MVSMRQLGVLVRVVALGALWGCGSITAPEAHDLAQARQHWALSNIRSYEFTASRSCFCAPASLRPIKVVVTDGVVTQRVYAGSSEEVPDSPSEFSTVEA